MESGEVKYFAEVTMGRREDGLSEEDGGRYVCQERDEREHES